MAKATDNMDYAEHEQTYGNFIAMLKFAIVALAIATVALYSFVIAGNFWLGLFLLIVAVPAGLGVNMLGKARS